ncbi:MAG: barstar family protein [Oscillospiraceae bacterium]|nr:barstar family protein [Oscillospiraceae bacterium]
MREITLDFTDCALRYELHLELRRALGAPEWYGMNLDALNDIVGEIGEPTKITVLGAGHLRDFFGRYGETLVKILESNGNISVSELS